MSATRKILKDSLWLTLAMMSGRGVVVLSGIAIARFFGAEAFALFVFIHLTATSATTITMFGLKSGLPRFIARMQIDDSADALSHALIAMLVVLLGLTIAVGFMALIPPQVIGLPDPQARVFLLALTFSIGLNNLLVGANIGLERFQTVALGTFAMGAVMILGVGLAIWMQISALTLMAYLLATLTSVVLLLPRPLRAVRSRMATQAHAWSRENFRAVGQYIGPMFASTILTSTGIWLAGRSLLTDTADPNAFAFFALGLQWFGLAQMLSNVVGKSVLASFTKTIFLQDHHSHRETLRSAILISIVGSLFVFLVVYLFAGNLVKLYGDEFSRAHGALVLFSGVSVVAAPVVILNSDLIARAQYTVVLYCNAVWWLMIVIGAFFLSDRNALSMISLIFLAYFLQTSLLFLVALWRSRKEKRGPSE